MLTNSLWAAGSLLITSLKKCYIFFLENENIPVYDIIHYSIKLCKEHLNMFKNNVARCYSLT